jgi:hypothetical protein
MLAEINDSPIVEAIRKPGTTKVNVTVIVAAGASPTIDPPTFWYRGLDTERSIWIDTEASDFTLTLSPANLPPGSGYAMTFAPQEPGTAGPITWRYPGSKAVMDKRPDYITEPELSADLMVLKFSVTNTASPGKDVLVSFTLSVLVTGPATPPSKIFESQDPTIINVDLPGQKQAPVV